MSAAAGVGGRSNAWGKANRRHGSARTHRVPSGGTRGRDRGTGEDDGSSQAGGATGQLGAGAGDSDGPAGEHHREARLRVTFERPDGVPSPDGSGRYPTCASVQQKLERAYVSPASILEFAEEASWRADRLWSRGAEELRLICFGERNRPASLQAEAVVITPIDR